MQEPVKNSGAIAEALTRDIQRVPQLCEEGVREVKRLFEQYTSIRFTDVIHVGAVYSRDGDLRDIRVAVREGSKQTMLVNIRNGCVCGYPDAGVHYRFVADSLESYFAKRYIEAKSSCDPRRY